MHNDSSSQQAPSAQQRTKKIRKVKILYKANVRPLFSHPDRFGLSIKLSLHLAFYDLTTEEPQIPANH